MLGVAWEEWWEVCPPLNGLNLGEDAMVEMEAKRGEDGERKFEKRLNAPRAKQTHTAIKERSARLHVFIQNITYGISSRPLE